MNIKTRLEVNGGYFPCPFASITFIGNKKQYTCAIYGFTYSLTGGNNGLAVLTEKEKKKLASEMGTDEYCTYRDYKDCDLARTLENFQCAISNIKY